MENQNDYPAIPFQFLTYSHPRNRYALTWILGICLCLAQHIVSAQCPAPPNCGVNPTYFCSEYTNFNWAIIPDGSGFYNIYAKQPANANVAVSYCLMTGNTVIDCQSGNSVVFTRKSPLCYTIVICVQDLVHGEGPQYCCQTLPCMAEGPACCGLNFQFYTSYTNPVWQFGDNTSSNLQNPAHEYSNINSYPVVGTPNASITVSKNGTVQFQQQLDFAEGIWIGQDCQDSGNASAIMNSINPSLPVLPGLSHIDEFIAIKGSVTMNANYQFTGCDFCMHPSARIIAATPVLSFLDGTTMHEAPCVTGAWYGIELRSGSIIGTNASIKGAYNAIRVSHNLANSVLRLTGCTFGRNYIGINISAPVTFAVFNGNTFGDEGSLLQWPGLPPTPCSWFTLINKPSNPEPFAGIYAATPEGKPAVRVGFPGTLLNINRFVNLSNGIYLNDANGEVIQRCQFKNMLSGGYPNDDGMGIALFTANFRRLNQFGLGKASTDLTFENCVHAVLVSMPQFSSGNVLLSSQVNNMNNVQHGYTLYGGITATFRSLSIIRHNRINYTGTHGILCENVSSSSRLQINYNRIATATSNNSLGIFAANFIPQPLGADYRIKIGNNLPTAGLNFEDGIYGGLRGISVAASGHILVENNKVVDFSEFGIYNTDSPEDDLRCNNVSSATGDYSIFNYLSPNVLVEYNQTDGGEHGLAFTQVSSNSTVKCNKIGSHNVGLYYDANAMVGDQLPSLTSAGNIWNGVYSNYAAELSNGGTTVNNHYFYRAGEINVAQIYSLLPDWFKLVTTGVTCAETGCPTYELTPRAVNDLDIRIADGTLNPTGLSGYLLKRVLFNDLLYYPSLAQGNTTLQGFQSSFGTANGGKLVSAEKSMVDGYLFTPTQQTQWDTTANSLDSAFSQLRNLDSLIQIGADPQLQETQRATLLQQSLADQAAMQSLYSSNLSTRVSSSNAILQSLNSISPVGVWETNEKTLNTIFLNTAFVDVAPSAAQISQILQIAQLCSADAGPVVFRARNWYHTLTGIIVEVSCNGIMERSANKEEQVRTQSLTISPNPAQNKIVVQFFNIPEGVSQLEIFDIAGTLKQSIEVSMNGDAIEISTLGYKDGIYFCRLIANSRVVSTAKFSILH